LGWAVSERPIFESNRLAGLLGFAKALDGLAEFARYHAVRDTEGPGYFGLGESPFDGEDDDRSRSASRNKLKHSVIIKLALEMCDMLACISSRARALRDASAMEKSFGSELTRFVSATKLFADSVDNKLVNGRTSIWRSMHLKKNVLSKILSFGPKSHTSSGYFGSLSEMPDFFIVHFPGLVLITCWNFVERWIGSSRTANWSASSISTELISAQRPMRARRRTSR
jgi:hypothetical protein